SGTTHLLAISGFNMTLVAATVGLIARGRVRPIVTASLTVATVIAYSLLVGLAPSVVRAALMAVVASCGLAFGRRPAIVNALALALRVVVEPAAALPLASVAVPDGPVAGLGYAAVTVTVLCLGPRALAAAGAKGRELRSRIRLPAVRVPAFSARHAAFAIAAT